MKTRNAAVAGAFYPADKEEINKMLNEFFKNIPKIKLEKEPKALIVPHAGYIYSGQVAAYAYSLLKKSKSDNPTISSGSIIPWAMDVALFTRMNRPSLSLK